MAELAVGHRPPVRRRSWRCRCRSLQGRTSAAGARCAAACCRRGPRHTGTGAVAGRLRGHAGRRQPSVGIELVLARAAGAGSDRDGDVGMGGRLEFEALAPPRRKCQEGLHGRWLCFVLRPFWCGLGLRPARHHEEVVWPAGCGSRVRWFSGLVVLRRGDPSGAAASAARSCNAGRDRKRVRCERPSHDTQACGLRSAFAEVARLHHGARFDAREQAQFHWKHEAAVRIDNRLIDDALAMATKIKLRWLHPPLQHGVLHASLCNVTRWG